jgi:hypothetical protein
MIRASTMSTLLRDTPRRALVAIACTVVLVTTCLAGTSTAVAAAGVSATRIGLGESGKPNASATLQQCLTAETQAERSATFAGEMSAIPGTARMEMRFEVLERMPADLAYHTVTAPGLRVWSSSAPGVKTYRNLNKVTNLAAPAFYRAAVRFRWINAKGKLLKVAELRTHRCEQPTPPKAETETPAAAGASPTTSG